MHVGRVRADGGKKSITLESGHRESAESWANLAPDAARRRTRAPVDDRAGFLAERDAPVAV